MSAGLLAINPSLCQGVIRNSDFVVVSQKKTAVFVEDTAVSLCFTQELRKEVDLTFLHQTADLVYFSLSLKKSRISDSGRPALCP